MNDVQEGLWKNYYDVVILPPPPVRDYAIDLSRQLQRFGAKFVLGKQRFVPHVSLYHIPVRPEDFEDFSNEVSDVAAGCKGGELKLTGIEMPLLMTDKPAWLSQLHRDIVRRTLKFFDWDYGAEETWAAESPRAKTCLEKYGTPMIGRLFRPHITLTSFEDKAVAREIPPPGFKPLAFPVDDIWICELGPSHSCQRVIRRFRALEGYGK